MLNAYSKNSNILNIVNMVSITFSGIINDGYKLFIGGIFGGSEGTGTIRNCVNYGTVTHAGVADQAYLGGIAGTVSCSTQQNCINYGSFAFTGESKRDTYIGGIAGLVMYSSCTSVFDNCVSAGAITYGGSSSIGAIIGSIDSLAELSNCYWDDKLGLNPYGRVYMEPTVSGLSSFNDEFVLNKTVSVGEYEGDSLIDALNACVEYNAFNSYSHWLLNTNNKATSFVVNDNNKELTFDSSLILLPSLASNGNKWFDGWYIDSDYTVPLTDFGSNTYAELYGRYGKSDKNFTITFDVRGGSPAEPFTATPGTAVEFPATTKENYMLSYWETDGGDRAPRNFTVPAHDVTLHAVWVPIRISTPEGLIEFSNAVNSGKANYNGITVYVDNDIVFTDELSKKFEPIGIDDTYDKKYNYFAGTFDGQGHAIKNLKLFKTGDSADSKHLGLFRYSRGMTIKNLVMDESCTYVDDPTVLSSMFTYLGAIVGDCYAEFANCIIENCVNKMNITYDITNSYVTMGGIAGNLVSPLIYGTFNSKVINCVNHGVIKVVGLSDGHVHMGGIAGNGIMGVYGCVNYGDVIFSEENTTGYDIYLDMGGITGENVFITIANCTNYGKVVKPIYYDDHKPSSGPSTGAIVGYAFIGIAVIAIVVVAVVVRVFRSKNDKDKYSKVDTIAVV